MELPKTSGIYMVKNTINNKCYIGQSQDIRRRIWMHEHLLNNGIHYNPHLQNAWNKYGSSSFEVKVLELCLTDQLNEREMYYIQLYDSFKSGYNRTVGGGGIRGVKMSDSARQKMRDSHRDFSKENHPQARGVVLLNTGETFSCILNAAEKYHIAKSDISKNAKRCSRSAGSLNGVRLVWAYLEDYEVMSDEDIERLLYLGQAWIKGELCYKAKRVICLTTMDVFGTILEAADKYNMSTYMISSACHGKRNHETIDKESGKVFKWMFYDDYLLHQASDSLSGVS